MSTPVDIAVLEICDGPVRKTCRPRRVGDHRPPLADQPHGDLRHRLGAPPAVRRRVQQPAQPIQHGKLLKHPLAAVAGDLSRAADGVKAKRQRQVQHRGAAGGNLPEKGVILVIGAGIEGQAVQQLSPVQLVPGAGEMPHHFAPVAKIVLHRPAVRVQNRCPVDRRMGRARVAARGHIAQPAGHPFGTR